MWRDGGIATTFADLGAGRGSSASLARLEALAASGIACDHQLIENDAARSAIITDVRCVLARGMTGMMEASTTESLSTPMKRQRGSTTADGSSGEPIRHDPAACT